MKIFGWTEEPNECCYGIESMDVSKDDISDRSDKEDGLEVLDGSEMPFEGMWFRTFLQAKRTQIHILECQIQWRKEAIASLRKERKSDL